MKEILRPFVAEPSRLEKRKATHTAANYCIYCGFIARHSVNASSSKIDTYELLHLLHFLRPSRVRALEQ